MEEDDDHESHGRDGSPARQQEHERDAELHDRSSVRQRPRQPARSDVVHRIAPQVLLEELGDQRRVRDHRGHHVGEVPVELRRRSTPPDGHHDELGGHDHVDEREQEDQRGHPVVLRPRGQEDRLVAQPDDRQHHEQRDQARRLDHGEPFAGQTLTGQSGHRPVRRSEQGPQRCRDDRDVEHDVDDRAGGAAGERDAFRPRRQADRARAQPVQEGADRRQEPQGERAEAAAEPEHFEQQGPEDDLLEDDRLGPPVGDVAEAADARRCRGEEEPAQDVEPDLEQVEEVDRVGRAESVQGPVLLQDLRALGPWQCPPLVDVDVRQAR